MAESVVYKLSALDQSMPRTYLRYALCFSHDNSIVTAEEVTSRLRTSLNRAISHMPMLAGTVHPARISLPATAAAARRQGSGVGFADIEQQGGLDVHVTVDEACSVEPSVRDLRANQLPFTYADLAARGMPPEIFTCEDSTLTSDDRSPVLHVQATFIPGGVFIFLSVHHSVADIIGLASLIRCMSIRDLPHRELNFGELLADVAEQADGRRELSNSREYYPDREEFPLWDPSTSASPYALKPEDGVCRVLTFNFEALQCLSDLVNNRFQDLQECPDICLNELDCLVGLLWKGVTRARYAGLSKTFREGQESALIMPVSVRKLINPLLDADYIGNTCISSYIKLPVIQLSLPFEVGNLAVAAYLVRRSISEVTEDKARIAIAIINEASDVRALNEPCIDYANDIVINNWADAAFGDEASLGLGLGTPQFVRSPRIGFGCTLLPANKRLGVWEVQVELTQEEMLRLLSDEGLKPFLD